MKETDSKMPRSWEVCSKLLNNLEINMKEQNVTDINTNIQYAILWELNRIADTLQLHIAKKLDTIADTQEAERKNV